MFDVYLDVYLDVYGEFIYRIPDPWPIARIVKPYLGVWLPYNYFPSCYGAPYGYSEFASDLQSCFITTSVPGVLAIRILDLTFVDPDYLSGLAPLVFPNPTSGTIYSTWDGHDTVVYWQLINARGDLLDFGDTQVWQHKFVLNITQELATGRYTLLIRNADASAVRYHTVIKD